MMIFDEIKEGAKMGYSATFVKKQNNGKKYNTLLVSTNAIGAKSNNRLTTKNRKELEDCIITGWLYVGELFGESKIPKGQKFRVKGYKGLIGFIRCRDDESECKACNGILEHLYNEKGEFLSCKCYDKSEIEPVFN